MTARTRFRARVVTNRSRLRYSLCMDTENPVAEASIGNVGWTTDRDIVVKLSVAGESQTATLTISQARGLGVALISAAAHAADQKGQLDSGN